MDWGLLGGERLSGTRRVRTLGLGAAVRAYNELAVPGLGGVWFGRQLVLALLGIHLAEAVRRGGRGPTNIAAANAVEALAVWTTLCRNGWTSDPRLPGSLKLRRHNRDDNPKFKIAGSRDFYVSQPMRIGTRDALLSLGFVEAGSRRFNSYAVSGLGRALLDATCPRARQGLAAWVGGTGPTINQRSLVDELDPTRPLPDAAREILREAFVSGPDLERARRRDALAFVEGLGSRHGGHVSWERRPPEIRDVEHWADMRAGAALAGVLEAAAGDEKGGSVLGVIEARMGATGSHRLSLGEARDLASGDVLDTLRTRAREFLATGYDPSPGREATRFCQECADEDPEVVTGRLLGRDGRILRLVGDVVLAGTAFKGRPLGEREPVGQARDRAEDEALEDAPEASAPPLPKRISIRIRNLAALAVDLRATSRAIPGI